MHGSRPSARHGRVSWGPVHRAASALRYLGWGLQRPRCLFYRERILIAGLPKTGTTALYFAVASALPFARSCFEPPDLAAALEPGRRPYLVKHLLRIDRPDPVTGLLDSFDRRVLLVRDPRDRMISSQLYHLYHAAFVEDPERRRSLLALIEAKERDPAGLSFGGFCRRVKALGGADFFTGLHVAARRFDAFLRQWGGQFHQLRYEDFVAGRLKPLRRHLGLPLRNAAAPEQPARRVLRTGLAGDWRNWLTAADVAELRPALQPFLERLGYGDDWRLNEPERLDPAHGSDYVRRLLAERDSEPAAARDRRRG